MFTRLPLSLMQESKNGSNILMFFLFFVFFLFIWSLNLNTAKLKIRDMFYFGESAYDLIHSGITGELGIDTTLFKGSVHFSVVSGCWPRKPIGKIYRLKAWMTLGVRR